MIHLVSSFICGEQEVEIACYMMLSHQTSLRKRKDNQRQNVTFLFYVQIKNYELNINPKNHLSQNYLS
jgi:hypothetical protein